MEHRLQYQVGPRVRAIESGEESQGAETRKVTFQYTGFGAIKPQRDEGGRVQTISATSEGRTETLKRKPILDGRGRVIENQRWRLEYSVKGQLIEVRDRRTNLPVASYRYNAKGQRVSKTVHSQELVSRSTYFLWQQNHLAAEIDADGMVVSQYLYLNADGPEPSASALAFAKLESGHNPGNPGGQERVLYVHNDHRGAPMAMTTQNQTPVWRKDPLKHPWGGGQPEHHKAELNLRLPGQYFDAETGLHDNLHRTFDPDTGRYLQPDPLGYSDSADAYQYASGDPINKTDPLGLYEIDVHYYMTFTIARLAGLSLQQSNVMATAAQYVDDNDFTRPLNLNSRSLHARRLELYHFTQAGYDPVRGDRSPDEYWDYRIKNPQNPQLKNLLNAANFGVGVPGQELKACARIQLFGEYLHTLEDTFGHRDPVNAPIGVNFGLGHALYGKEPDKTFNNVVTTSENMDAVGAWSLRESRTLEMERTVFEKIQSNFGKSAVNKDGFPIRFEDIESSLKAFNRVQEDEDSGKGEFVKKKAILSALLSANGLGPRPDYDVQTACELRKFNLASLKDNVGLLPGETLYDGSVKMTGVILSVPKVCASQRPS
jgi:RHS repeat-associated protein